MNSKKDSDKPLLLDIGCGKNKLSRPGYKIIGIDIWENSDADLIIPANKLPFDNESVDVIHTRHFLEHFTYNETVDLFSEFFRVLKPKSKLEIIVPHVSCIAAFQDPTHKAFFTKRSFYKYQHTGFSVKNIEFFWFRNPYKGWFPFLVYPINKLLNTFHGLERFASIIGGIYELQCVMEKDQLELDFLHTPGAKLSN
jgi:SAM-dependent methyltransferase|tara:strand:- start:1114 stop:1704 length:591 start_codon:yes stop_codon:yes gene_type:complete